MSLFVPYPRSVQTERNYTGRLTATTGTLITAAGTSHTLGSKTELIAATAFDAHRIRIWLANTKTAATQTDQLLNIYVGAASSEQVLIPNLLAGYAWDFASANPPRSYEFPLFIPSGTRLSADLQALITDDTCEVVVELFGGGQPQGWVGKRVECVGAVTASSQGTSVTPGGASEGSFTDIGATSNEWRYVLPQIQGSMNTGTGNTAVAVDIGAGGVALEEEFLFSTTSNETSSNFSPLGRYRVIPSGTTLQLRAQASGTPQALDMTIYGVY
jgi:hypothetical protein